MDEKSMEMVLPDGFPVQFSRKDFRRYESGAGGGGVAGWKFAGTVLLAGCLCFGQGCTVNITSSGEHAIPRAEHLSGYQCDEWIFSAARFRES